jgi:hypothetical protein
MDPMAEKYQSWSGYNYVMDNPLKLVGPDGQSADNIIITETSVVPDGSGGTKLVATKYEYGADASGGYGFIDPATGSVYSGSNKFIIESGDALNTLRSEDEGKKLVDGLVSSPSDIEIANRGNNSADMAAGEWVLWNPAGTSSAPDESGSTTRPPYIGLAHELAHIEDVKNGTINLKPWFSIVNSKGKAEDIENAEIYATHKENLIRKEQGLQLRAYYAKSPTGKGERQSRIVKNGKSIYYNKSGATNYKKIKKDKDRHEY